MLAHPGNNERYDAQRYGTSDYASVSMDQRNGHSTQSVCYWSCGWRLMNLIQGQTSVFRAIPTHGD